MRQSTSDVMTAEVIAFRDAAEFETWLAAHVDRKAGVWLKIAKKASGVPSLTDDESDGRWEAAYSSRKQSYVHQEEIE
jgi:uncharacterized protein YdeI (YjbR/CyaY-like superfamily)